VSEAAKIEACIADIKAGLCCPRIHGCESDGDLCLVRQAFARAGLIADPFDELGADDGPGRNTSSSSDPAGEA